MGEEKKVRENLIRATSLVASQLKKSAPVDKAAGPTESRKAAFEVRCLDQWPGKNFELSLSKTFLEVFLKETHNETWKKI